METFETNFDDIRLKEFEESYHSEEKDIEIWVNEIVVW